MQSASPRGCPDEDGHRAGGFMKGSMRDSCRAVYHHILLEGLQLSLVTMSDFGSTWQGPMCAVRLRCSTEILSTMLSVVDMTSGDLSSMLTGLRLFWE